MDGAGAPLMYHELARWWPLISPPEEYAEEAAFYLARLVEACDEPPRTLLELGSGGGNNASHLKASLQLVLVEPSEEMLRVSRALNPECEHVRGDMRTVRLGREFDCVFVHDAVSYMASEADLRRAIRTAYLHCRPGGAALFAPDHLTENFRPATDHGGSDGDAEAIRFLEWSWDPQPGDGTCLVDYILVMRDVDGRITIRHDRHVEGLFSRDTWLGLLRECGFDPVSVPLQHSEIEPGTHELFVARKPS